MKKFRFELPNTRIKASVSFKWSLRPSGVDDNKGVIPDIILRYSIQDLLTEEDHEMNYVLNLIKKK